MLPFWYLIYSEGPRMLLKNRLPRGGNRCDFCACHFVYKLYACQNFEWNQRPVFSRPRIYGRWGACEQCFPFVEARDWDGLTSRVMKQVKKRAGLTEDGLVYLRRDLRLMYGTLEKNILPGLTLTVYQPHYTRVSISDADVTEVGLPKRGSGLC